MGAYLRSTLLARDHYFTRSIAQLVALLCLALLCYASIVLLVALLCLDSSTCRSAMPRALPAVLRFTLYLPIFFILGSPVDAINAP